MWHTNSTLPLAREGTKASRLLTQFPFCHLKWAQSQSSPVQLHGLLLAASSWMWVQCYVLCREITWLNILFTLTLLWCLSDCLLAGVITGCHSMLITALQGVVTTTEEKQACLLLPTERSVLYWLVQERCTAVQIKPFSTVCNGRNG